MVKRIVLAMAAVALSLIVSDARAQSDEKKFEVGAQFSILQVPTRRFTNFALATTSESHATEYGVGGRIGYNVSPNFALEAEGNFFPRDRDLEGGRKIQGLFGVKAGKKFDKVGVFAKARPGFIRFERGDYRQAPGVCILVFPPPLACYEPVAKTNFAFDVGGVIELYPSSRTTFVSTPAILSYVFPHGGWLCRVRRLVRRQAFRPRSRWPQKRNITFREVWVSAFAFELGPPQIYAD